MDTGRLARSSGQRHRLAAKRGGEFTAESIRQLVGDPGRDGLMGARLMAAARQGQIVKVGYETARRPERHGGVVAVWRGTDAP